MSPWTSRKCALSSAAGFFGLLVQVQPRQTLKAIVRVRCRSAGAGAAFAVVAETLTGRPAGPSTPPG